MSQINVHDFETYMMQLYCDIALRSFSNERLKTVRDAFGSPIWCQKVLSEQPNVGSGFGDDAETPDLKHHLKLNMGPHLELGIHRVQKSIHKCKGINTHFPVTSYNFMLDVGFFLCPTSGLAHAL